MTPVFKKGDKSAYFPDLYTLQGLPRRIKSSHLIKHDFPANQPSETQLTLLVENLTSSVSAGNQTNLVLLDF